MLAESESHPTEAVHCNGWSMLRVVRVPEPAANASSCNSMHESRVQLWELWRRDLMVSCTFALISWTVLEQNIGSSISWELAAALPSLHPDREVRNLPNKNSKTWRKTEANGEFFSVQWISLSSFQIHASDRRANIWNLLLHKRSLPLFRPLDATFQRSEA